MATPANKKSIVKDDVNKDSVELEDMSSTAAPFNAKARVMLKELDKAIFAAKVNAFGVGETIQKKVWNAKSEVFEVVKRTGVTKTMYDVHSEIMKAIEKDNMADYLRCIAKIEAILNVKVSEHDPKKASDTIEFYQSLGDQVNAFKKDNSDIIQGNQEYQEAFDELDFDLRVRGDLKNGAEYLKYKEALALQEEGLRRTQSFMEENRSHLVMDGTADILADTVNCILQTYQGKDLATYYARAKDIINNHCPSLDKEQKESALIAFKTLVEKHEVVMNKIEKQWKDFYVRTALAIVSSIAAPLVGVGAGAGLVQNASTIVGGIATGGGLIASEISTEGRLMNVQPSARPEDTAAALWEKKGSLAATGAQTVTGIVLSLTIPPVAAAFGGVQFVKSIIQIGGTAAKETDILAARQQESVKLLGENTRKYKNFKADGKEMEPMQARASKQGMFKPAGTVAQNDPSKQLIHSASNKKIR